MSGLFEKAKAMANASNTPAPPDPGSATPGAPAGPPASGSRPAAPPERAGAPDGMDAVEELLPVESGTPERGSAPPERASALPAAPTGGPPASVAGTDIVFDEDSGISKEDQKDILQEIEQAASENKFSAGPQAFVLHAQRKGVFMPMLVNLLAVALLAVGGLVLYYFFQRGETTLKEETVGITSAEGKLIEQLKKEAEEKLLAKNREISQIQGQLSEIDQQRLDLVANMDAKVAAREQELRQGMEAALEQERQRLRRQGISEDDINRRLVALEAQKTGEFESQLSAYRRQAEEERLASENNLKTMQQEFQASLAKAGQERQQLLDDSRRREEELKSQLQARAEALEAESRQARQELARISEQRDKEQLAATQLIGFYSRVKGDMQASMLDQALVNLEGIRQYLNDPAIGTLPGIQQRREMDFFVVDSLSSLVRGEMRKASADTTSLVAAANLLTQLRKRVQDGDALLARGEAAAAQKEYGEALALVPEVDKAYRYLLDRQLRQLAAEAETAAAARGAREAEAADQERREALRSSLTAAQAAFDSRDYAGTVEHYTSALSYLPEEPSAVKQLVGQLRQAGYELAVATYGTRDSEAAAAPLAVAQRLQTQGRYLQAISAYGDLVDKYPASTQVRAALQGIGSSVEALSRQAEAATGDSSGRRRQVEQRAGEAEKLQGRLAEVEQQLKESQAIAASLQREKDMLSGERDSLRKEVETLRAQLASARQAAQETDAKLQAALNDEAMKQKLARLEAIETSYNRIVASYREYAAKEDSLLSAKGENGLVEAKQHLNTFLISTEESFPGLWTRIKRYDAAFAKDGREGALEDVNDVLYELSLRKTAAERRQFLDAELQSRRGDQLMNQLLTELKGL
jgi:hypothetical protein